MKGEARFESRLATLADAALRGELLSRESARSLLHTADDGLRELLQQSFRIRERTFGRRVKVCVLQNARSGLCPEDCHYCSQSARSTADIPRYRLMSEERLLDGARHAVASGARRYCMVTSGRGPSARDLARLAATTRRVKAEFPDLEICVCAGILDEAAARDLKAAGVGWVNHNLNTSERFYPEICTTHTYADRVRTVRAVKAAGLATCSGGIIGMGENDDDVIDLACALRELEVDSVPVNFLHPIDGTPLAGVNFLDPLRALKALCLFRFTNPRAEIRAAGGRERNLREWQALALYPANSIFVQGYLTTPGQSADEALRMIEEMGFEVEGSAVAGDGHARHLDGRSGDGRTEAQVVADGFDAGEHLE
ncbi:MAG: biotin synthase BioB [Candidatus Binatia bacterium]